MVTHNFCAPQRYISSKNFPMECNIICSRHVVNVNLRIARAARSSVIERKSRAMRRTIYFSQFAIKWIIKTRNFNGKLKRINDEESDLAVVSQPNHITNLIVINRSLFGRKVCLEKYRNGIWWNRRQWASFLRIANIHLEDVCQVLAVRCDIQSFFCRPFRQWILYASRLQKSLKNAHHEKREKNNKEENVKTF